MTTMKHEFELSTDTKCTTENDFYFNVNVSDGSVSSNYQYGLDEIEKMVEQVKFWKLSFTVTVTRVEIIVKQQAIDYLFGYEF